MSDRAKAIGMAAMWAALYYLMFYVLVVHFFVLLKWPASISAGHEAEDLLLAQQYKPTADLPTQEDIDRLLKEISEAKERDTTEHHQSARVTLDTYQVTLLKLDQIAPSTTSPFLSQGLSPVDVQKLRLAVLLQRESLSNVTDTTFASISAVTVKQLEELIKKQDELDWTVIHDLLLPEGGYPAKHHMSKEEMHDMVCAAPEVDQNDASDELDNIDGDDYSDNDLSSYAHERDVDELLQRLHDALKARTADDVNLFIGQHEKMKKKLKHAEQSLANALEDAASFVTTTVKERQSGKMAHAKPKHAHSVDISRCVNEDDILALVEIGLDALHRKKDLRSALLNAFEVMDPEAAKNLILDAHYDLEPVAPDMGPANSLNLRRLIDTPAMKQSAAMIDGIMDLISGHNDWLDQQLDKIAEAASGGQRSSLGKVLTAAILKQSGKVDVPVLPPLRKLLQRK